MVGGMIWKGATAIENDRGALADVTDVLNIGVAEAPTVHPSIKILSAWKSFLSGENPRDDFYGQDIVKRDHQAMRDLGTVAATWPAQKDMLKWTSNQMGVVSNVFNMKVGHVLGTGAILRKSKRGTDERMWQTIKMDEADEAFFKHRYVPDNAQSLVREYYWLRRVGRERMSPEQHERYGALSSFYKKYLVQRKHMKKDYDSGNTIAAAARGEHLEEVAEQYWKD
jgi:hypothetical protein